MMVGIMNKMKILYFKNCIFVILLGTNTKKKKIVKISEFCKLTTISHSDTL